MTATADFLNTDIPIRITSQSEFFDDIAEHWRGMAETTFDLLRRESTDQIRYAMAVKASNLKSVAKQYFDTAPRVPTFTPFETGVPPYVAYSETDALVAIWDSEGERPVADLTRPRKGFKYRMRQAFWAVVDAPKDIYDGVCAAWNAIP
jgi:hypothetical protein